MAVEVDEGDIGRAWQLLWGDAPPGADRSRTRCVLFDFDGPICRLFPEGSSREVADSLRLILAKADFMDALNKDERDDKDPHVVLRAVHRAGRERNRDVRDLVRRLEAEVTKGELRALPESLDTEDAAELIRRLHGSGLELAVVTNNSPLVASQYLRSKNLLSCFDAIHGRGADPDLMKPDPDVLERALNDPRLSVTAGEAVMIGDSPSDFEAARAAGVEFIGYARNADKLRHLRAVKAETVIGAYAPLLERARESGRVERGACFTGSETARA
jgi:HAD superfamily hydrolase (TIGR01549 family)